MPREKKQKKPFKACIFMDTETSVATLQNDRKIGYVCLYQFNDLRNLIAIDEYQLGINDNIVFYRYENEVVEYIQNIVQWGKTIGVIPVVCAYNLRYDIQSVFDTLHKHYDMKCSAQNSINIYTLDLLEENTIVLRFWDMFFMEPNGLDAMGRICGVHKFHTWDYSKMRNPSTRLTQQEVEYAKRDVQILPAYLAWLCHVNTWILPKMFGDTIISATSIVRQFGFTYYGKMKTSKKSNVARDYLIRCRQETPIDYDAYAMERACLRGGLAFTSAKTCGVIQHDVCSIDVTSMHHTFMPCSVPTKFFRAQPQHIVKAAKEILKTNLKEVLSRYNRPFNRAFNALFEFTNLRLKKNTCFSDLGIATLSREKTRVKADFYPETMRDERKEYTENLLREGGYHDIVKGGEYALGKLYKADKVQIWLTEIELWCVGQVYDWDTIKPIRGEMSFNWREAPIMLQLESMHFFTQKNDLKAILQKYKGTPYNNHIPHTIPDNIRENIANGIWTHEELLQYYNFVKSCLNAIYGTQVQDMYKPNWEITDVTELEINKKTIVNDGNWAERQPRQPKALFNCGMRIVARSRMHLLIAIELIYEKYGNNAQIIAGDTDSLKIALKCGLTPQDVLKALTPLHNAADTIMENDYITVRETFPYLVKPMMGIGHFTIEKIGNDYVVPWHIELWNKCRVSVDTHMKPKIVCAGLIQTEKGVDINDVYCNMIKAHGVEWSLTHGIGYGVVIPPHIAHNVARTQVKSINIVDFNSVDYQGEIESLHVHEVYALFNAQLQLADISNSENLETIMYIHYHYGRKLETRTRFLDLHECGYMIGETYEY